MKKRFLIIVVFLFIIFIFLENGCSQKAAVNQNPPSNEATGEFNIEDNETIEENKNPYAGAIITLKPPFGRIGDVVLMGNDLYMCVSDNTEFAKNIIKYNLQTKQTEKIFISEFDDPSVQNLMINDKWLIWTDSTADGVLHRIYVKDLKTGKIKLIAKLAFKGLTPISPFLYEDFIAWVEPTRYDGKYFNGKVVLYNLNNHKTKVVGTIRQLELYNNFIYINDNKILWTDSYDGKGYYKFYDLKTNKIKTYESKYLYPGYAEFAGNKIYSLNFNNIRDWTSHKFEEYDIKNNTYTIITGHITRFRLGKKYILVMNSQSDLELYSMDKLERIPLEIRVDSIIECNGKLVATFDEIDLTTTIYIIDLEKIKSKG
ncbi:hypothetical protein [Carboxydothermus ferrireducens]|uniref:DUF5050 domain-containing protein n=1 Tax=Carboxydothermus ferrireducens DSM 11255 TaxID=1119529 RepID=A0ABX2RBP9_9THEO|nr:hypothetical protein [Carboxydothermus ferrireducens]NYE58611.1 hypothetical protein [Carboxydothermus ferrireducens DSM 11255]